MSSLPHCAPGAGPSPILKQALNLNPPGSCLPPGSPWQLLLQSGISGPIFLWPAPIVHLNVTFLATNQSKGVTSHLLSPHCFLISEPSITPADVLLVCLFIACLTPPE